MTEVDKLAEYQARPLRQQRPPGGPVPSSAAPPAPVMASRDSSSQLQGAAAAKESAVSGDLEVHVWERMCDVVDAVMLLWHATGTLCMWGKQRVELGS